MQWQTLSFAAKGKDCPVLLPTMSRWKRKNRSDAVSTEASSRNLLAVRVGKAESSISDISSVSGMQARTKEGIFIGQMASATDKRPV